MKRIAAALVMCFLAAAPALANLYDSRGVAALVVATPQINRMNPQPPGSRVYYEIQNATGGYIDPDRIDDGYLASGQEVLIVPLSSGGSGGVFSTLMWTKIGGVWKFVGYIPSGNGRLGIYIESGRLSVETPVYGPGEPNCCPSKHHHILYTLDGVRLRKIDEYTSR